MFRSPHDDTAYLYNFMHSPTRLSASKTKLLDALRNHHDTPIFYLRLDLLFKFHLVLGAQAQRSSCYTTYLEVARLRRRYNTSGGDRLGDTTTMNLVAGGLSAGLTVAEPGMA